MKVSVKIGLIGVLSLAVLSGCAHNLRLGAHGGPDWAIWTHSDDREDCKRKEMIWFALGTAAFVYIVEKSRDQKNVQGSKGLASTQADINVEYVNQGLVFKYSQGW